jgi:hypothetical protein
MDAETAFHEIFGAPVSEESDFEGVLNSSDVVASDRE